MNNGKLDSLRAKIAQKHGFSELLSTGKKDQVTDCLVDLVSSFAEKKRFTEASHLRDWIIKIDPMALNKIIRSAELIDEAKFAAIDSDHFQTWLTLIRVLSREEYSSLYHHLGVKNYPNHQLVVKQGTYFPALIFVNSGRLELFTFSDGKDIHLKTAEAGEIVGGGTFFDPSTWTFSIKSKAAEVSILTYKAMHTLKKDHPALEAKLGDYCTRFAEPYSMARDTLRGRRAFIRNRVDGRTAILLLDKSGSSTGMGVNGDLFDISEGGISCLIRSSRKNNAVKLFGRKIRATLPVNGKVNAVSKDGTIVAVKGSGAAGNEYSLHVEFERKLNDTDMQRIVYTGRA